MLLLFTCLIFHKLYQPKKLHLSSFFHSCCTFLNSDIRMIWRDKDQRLCVVLWLFSKVTSSLLFKSLSIVLYYNKNNGMQSFSMDINHNIPYTLRYNSKQYHQRARCPICFSPSSSSISSSSQSTTCLLFYFSVENRCKSGELATVSSPEVWFPGCLIALTCQWCAIPSP